MEPPMFEQLARHDLHLYNFRAEFARRYGLFRQYCDRIVECGDFDKFTESYKHYGLVLNADNSIDAKEWAPGAEALALVGDFNNWDTKANPYVRGEFGHWTLKLSAADDGSCRIPHGSVIKVAVTHGGVTKLKLSPWARYVVRPPETDNSVIYHQIFYNPPPQDHVSLKTPSPKLPHALRIYEAHVGISSDEPIVNTYRNFADDVLPRIARQGYNTVQLMAVMEHVYYGSFGYQVSSFFAPSSRFGTPDDLRYLVEKAHSLGLLLFLDVVHSHACSNTEDALNEWDGTQGAYFHPNERGFHRQWGSRCFNYSELEVLRFLLSNLRYWIDEFGFDGFRFDGVTSMLYHSHGNESFSGDYEQYFGEGVDRDSILYLMLANYFLHITYPNRAITIAEEVSGMPALCRPLAEGGIGFDFRLAMAVPDMWIRQLKHIKDEDWNMGNIVFTLENRRWTERTVCYAESHDQALVGDKTIAFWLMDAEMYTNMSELTERTTVIERGLALHKLIRLVSMVLGGEAWLNFMGNEFGHPEWLDFPRAENGQSYHYARRQWKLVDDPLLRYKFLANFDAALMALEQRTQFLAKGSAYVSRKHEGDKVIVAERGGLVFIMNFNPTQSFADYRVGCQQGGKYRIALDSDVKEMGGHGRVAADGRYFTQSGDFDGRANSLQVYIPSRCVLVLEICDD